MKKFSVHIPMFDSAVRFVISDNADEATKYVNRVLRLTAEDVVTEKDFHYDDTDLGPGRTITFKNSDPVVWIPRIPKTSQEYGVLAHEALHAAIHILKKIGTPLSDASEEIYCYLQGYLVERALKEMCRK